MNRNGSFENIGFRENLISMHRIFPRGSNGVFLSKLLRKCLFVKAAMAEEREQPETELPEVTAGTPAVPVGTPALAGGTPALTGGTPALTGGTPALGDGPAALPSASTTLPPFPSDGDVDKATINASTDAFLNGSSEAGSQERDGNLQKQIKMMTVLAKVVTTNGRLISHDVSQLSRSVDKLAEFLKQDVETGQSCFESLKTAIANQANQFESLKEALLLLGANSKTAAAEEKSVRQKLLEEMKGCKEVMTHVRNNSANIMRHCANSQWEIRELRTGGTQKDRADANGGSVLCGIESQADNLCTTMTEGLTKLGIDVVKAVERGVDPDQSLIFKRKKEQGSTPMTPGAPSTNNPSPGQVGGPPPNVASASGSAAKRYKYCHPSTRIEYEGTMEDMQRDMQLWMQQMAPGPSGPPPVVHSGPPPAFDPAAGSYGGFPPAPPYGFPPMHPQMFGGYGTPTGGAAPP